MLARTLSLVMVMLSLSQAAVTRFAQDYNLGGWLYLVNRTYVLSRDYTPPDLVKPDVASPYQDMALRADPARYLEEMFEAAKSEKGYKLVMISGFRSFDRQAAIYQRRKNDAGKAKAALYVAPPGASEHQLGLAVDIGKHGGNGLKPDFGQTPEGQWVRENAHRFGYVIRYKAEWTATTGYAYEPWHIRFVGPEHATEIQRLDIPLEDYVELLRQAHDMSIRGTND